MSLFARIIKIRKNGKSSCDLEPLNLTKCNARCFFVSNRQNGQRRSCPCPIDRAELAYEKVTEIKCLFSQWISTYHIPVVRLHTDVFLVGFVTEFCLRVLNVNFFFLPKSTKTCSLTMYSRCNKLMTLMTSMKSMSNEWVIDGLSVC